VSGTALLLFFSVSLTPVAQHVACPATHPSVPDNIARADTLLSITAKKGASSDLSYAQSAMPDIDRFFENSPAEPGYTAKERKGCYTGQSLRI